MQELMRSNDMVLISFIGSLLDEAGIGHMVLDGNMSVMEGSLGIIPRRVLVEEGRLAHAKRLMIENGLEHELKSRA
jgi:hypothetical protein